MKTRLACLLVLSSFLASCGDKDNSSQSPTQNPPGTSNFKRIAITTAQSDGGLGLGGNAIVALENADGICHNEFPGFKALLSNEGRYNGANGDWVLKANTEYRRMDGTTVIGTTNANSVFNFPLQNSMGTTSVSAWTGLEANWGGSMNTCDDWTDAYAAGFGTDGDTGAVDSTSVANFGGSCQTQRKLICIEQ